MGLHVRGLSADFGCELLESYRQCVSVDAAKRRQEDVGADCDELEFAINHGDNCIAVIFFGNGLLL